MNVWLKKNIHAFSFVITALINTFCYTNTLFDSKSDSYALINFKFACNNNLTHVLIEKRIVSEFEENAATIDHAVKFSMNISENQQQEVWIYEMTDLEHHNIILKTSWLYD